MVYLLKSCVLKNNLCYNYIRKINEKSIVGEGSKEWRGVYEEYFDNRG